MPKPRNVEPFLRARALLARLGLIICPVPVDKIARALGAEVRYAPFDDELSGMIYVKDAVPIIGINALHHPNRQRFSLAHEIGHLDLHRNIITTAAHVDKSFTVLMRDSNSATGTDDIEIEANRFAAALLMPEELIEPELKQIKIDLEDDKPLETLAKKYRVSRQALDFRIRTLD